MATTTPNYGWTVPTSSDLVKDGATAIETLGDAIDASMNTALGTKKAGMVLLNTTSFTGQSSQAVSSVFNANYENYRIVYYGTSSADADMTIKFRISTTDTSVNYSYINIYAESGGSVGRQNATGASSMIVSQLRQTMAGFTLDIYRPFLAAPTELTAISGGRSATFNQGIYTSSATQYDSTSFDGINMIPTSGTITGKVAVYGYNI